MKKERRNRIIYLVMQIVFTLCALLFFVILLVCEPYDLDPCRNMVAVCVFMTVQMHRARKKPPTDKEN